MKKQFLLLTLVLVLMLAITSCATGTSQTTGTTQAGETSDGTTATTALPEAYTVRIVWLILTEQPKDLKLVEDEINKIALPDINVKAELMPIPMANWMQQTNLMLSSGEKMDLSIVYNSGGLFGSHVAAGRLQPIDDLLADYGQGIVSAISELSPEYLKPGMISGVTYGVTQLRDLATNMGLLCRKDIADEIGLDPDQKLTYADLEAIYTEVKAKYPGIYPQVPFNVGGSTGAGFYSWDVLGDGLGALSNYGLDNTTVINLYDTPEYKQICDTMYDWYKKGLILPDAATNTTNGVTLIKNDKGFAMVTNQKPGFANQQAKQIGRDMYAIPLTEPYTNTYQVNNFLWTIPTNCEDPVSAMKMLNLMYSDADVANLLIWGIEGKHYVKTDVENIIDYPAGVDSTTTGWGLNLGWEMGNQFLSYVWKGDSPDLMDELAAFNKSAKASKAMGFVFDSTSVKAEIAALTNVVNQYKLGLECGQSNPEETLPKFIADLEANGIDKVIAEKQKQLDAYLAGN